MANTPAEGNPPDKPPTEFLGLSDMAHRLFGSSSRAAKERVVRMADRGELAAIRIGRRGDRLFPAAEIDRLHTIAIGSRERDGRTAGPKN